MEAAVRALSRAGVAFVVVGMFGINLHAKDSSESFATQDIDVLLRPDVSTLKNALGALRDARGEEEA